MLRAIACLFLLAGVADAAPKKSKPTVDATQAKANVLFEKGQADFEAGNFQAAIELFKAAYELAHDPVYLFNIAQASRKVLDCEAAFDYFSRFLEAEPTTPLKSKVEQWMSEIQPCVEDRKRDREAAKRGDEAERKRREEELARQRAAATPRAAVVDRGKALRRIGIASGAAGMVGIAIGIVYSVKGSNLKSDIAASCGAPSTCQWDDPKVLAQDRAGDRANTRARIGYIAGGVAALGGTVLYLIGHHRVEHVMITPAEGGASISAHVRF